MYNVCEQDSSDNLGDRLERYVTICIHIRKLVYLFVCFMVFNATFNNISVISWRSVLLMEETGGPGESH
jgi:uncharacterized DUF497 family protein